MQFELIITPETLVGALLIFSLRVLNNSISTIRLITLARQQRLLTAFLGFFEALTFAITVAGVVTDLENVLNMFAYCFGFAVGGYVGMSLERWLITSYSIVNVFSAVRGHEVALALREQPLFGNLEIVELRAKLVSQLGARAGHHPGSRGRTRRSQHPRQCDRARAFPHQYP